MKREEVSKVSILTTKANFPTGSFDYLPSFYSCDNLDVYRINFFPKTIPFFYHSYNAGFFSKDLYKTIEIISPDIIHMCKIEWYIPNYLIVKKFSNTCKLICFSSYHKKEIKVKHFPMIVICNYIYERVNYVHVPTNALRNEMLSTFCIEEDKLKVVPNPLETISPLDFRYDKSPKIKTLISIARFEKNKQQLELIRALRKIPKHLVKDFRLILIGTDGGTLNAINHLLKDQKIENVFVKENVTDVEKKRLLSFADIYLNTSLSEAFSLATAEAMMFGLPILSFNIETVYELTRGKALYADQMNWDDFIKKLTLLLENVELRSELGKAMKEVSSEFLSMEKYTDEIIRLYIN